MARVALDADLVIGFLDPSDAQHDQAVELLAAHLATDDDVSIAATVYAEVIVRPLQHGTDAKVDEFLTAIDAHVVGVVRALARHAAQLRARHTALRLPDALALATALAAGAQLLTLERAFRLGIDLRARSISQARSRGIGPQDSAPSLTVEQRAYPIRILDLTAADSRRPAGLGSLRPRMTG